MTISKSWFSYLTRAFALSLCTALLLSFVSCSDSSTSQDPKVKIILDANGGSFSGTTETTQTLLIKRNQTSKLSTADELGLSRENHNFKGWAKSQQGTVEFNDGADITSSTDLTLYAQWEAVNTTYTVKHLLQNLAYNEYTEDEEARETKTGTYGTQTAAAAKTYEGFTANPFEQKTIQADGQTVVEIKYDRNTYTISYSSTYGEPPVSKTVKWGYILTAADLPDLTQTNYSFKGWLFDGDSIEAGYIVKKDINLTAQWDEIIATYTVKHLLQNLADNSYTEEAADQKTGKSGTQTTAAAKSYEGFTAKTFAQETIQADGSTVVEIKYDRNTYTVSYSSKYGDAPASKTVKYGYVLTAADLPVLPDTILSFNGWRLDGASIEVGFTVKTDITLTAQWDEIIASYTVKHLLQNLQDNDYTQDSTEQKSGTSGTQTAAAAKSYEGFTAKTFAQKTIQADGSTVVEIHYDRKTYTVSYSSEYGYAPNSKTVKYGYVLTAADLPFLSESETGYYYNGWVYENTSIEAGYTVKTDITLTASWNAVIVVYTVRHLLQNLQDDNYTEDEEAEEQIPVAYGTLIFAVAKTYEGFTAKLSEEKPIELGLGGSTVVEIYYDRNTYTVSYSSEYGDAPASKTVKYGYVLTVADLPDLTQTNYSFKGWILDGASISAGYTVKKDITLTAQWDEIIANYTVKHLLQNLQDDSYTKDSTEQKTGKSGTQTIAAAKTYEGFTAKSFTQATIQAYGSTVVEIYYDRKTYTVSYSSTYGEPPESKTVKYGYILTAADLPVLPDTVLSFNGWRLDGASIAAGYTVKTDTTLTAQWEAIFIVTKENFSAVIAALTKNSTIVVTGELTESDLASINEAITNSKYKVNLDLSQTTGISSIPDETFWSCKLSGITIPDSVTSIGDRAFYGCSALSSVTIGNSVTSIGVQAFDDCTSLSSVTIPDSVTTIDENAFFGCSSLSSVTIGNSVTTIDAQAFFGCTSLSSVTIPDSVTTIGYLAFQYCTSLSSVTIPESVTSIGSNPFGGCKILTTINVNSNNTNYCSIDGVLFNNGVTTLIQYPAGKQADSYTIPDSVTSIGDSAFLDCTSLSSVTIGNSVTTIHQSAFYGCSSLSSVAIPDSVTTIGNHAFQYCTSLSSVTIGDSVTSIGQYAFDNCKSLSSVTIPDSVTSIGHNAFGSCYSLSSVTIGNSVTSIGGCAFAYCTSLSSVTIPESVTFILSYAFRGCSKLTSITFADTTNWYRADSSTNWENKTGGILTSVRTPSKNANYFTYTYENDFWYKLDE